MFAEQSVPVFIAVKLNFCNQTRVVAVALHDALQIPARSEVGMLDMIASAWLMLLASGLPRRCMPTSGLLIGQAGWVDCFRRSL